MNGPNSFHGPIEGVIINDENAEEPLRLNDLFHFLNARQRSTSCPYCIHEGVWEVSMQDEADEQAVQKNPKMQLFKTEVADGATHTFVGMTCPNCGNFAQISTYKIREFLSGGKNKWAN